MDDVVSYKEALVKGLSKYYTGKVCCRGHISPRFVSDRSCIDCAAERRSRYQSQHKDRKSIYQEKYRQNNLGKMAAKEARRRATRYDATPRWLSTDQLQDIESIYLFAQRKGYHVDHIVPLKNRRVCGLHVPWNLQAIPAKENMIKHNKLIEEVIYE